MVSKSTDNILDFLCCVSISVPTKQDIDGWILVVTIKIRADSPELKIDHRTLYSIELKSIEWVFATSIPTINTRSFSGQNLNWSLSRVPFKETAAVLCNLSTITLISVKTLAFKPMFIGNKIIAAASSSLVGRVRQVFFNSLWPSDAIWRYRSWLISVQVMACCLTAPRPYLNHCWPINNGVMWHSPKTNFTRSVKYINSQMSLRKRTNRITATFPSGQWVALHNPHELQ